LDEIYLFIVKLSFHQFCPVLFFLKQTFGLVFDTLKKNLNMWISFWQFFSNSKDFKFSSKNSVQFHVHTTHSPPNNAEKFLIIKFLWKYWVLWQVKIEICESIKFYQKKEKKPTTYQKKINQLTFSKYFNVFILRTLNLLSRVYFQSSNFDSIKRLVTQSNPCIGCTPKKKRKECWIRLRS